MMLPEQRFLEIRLTSTNTNLYRCHWHKPLSIWAVKTSNNSSPMKALSTTKNPDLRWSEKSRATSRPIGDWRRPNRKPWTKSDLPNRVLPFQNDVLIFPVTQLRTASSPRYYIITNKEQSHLPLSEERRRRLPQRELPIVISQIFHHQATDRHLHA